MFVDDSGSARPDRGGGARAGGSVHILSGLIVHERDLRGARESVNDVKRVILAGFDPQSWEMHAYHMWNNRGDFSGTDRRLGLEGKREAFSRAAEGIAGSGATLVSVVVWKSRLPAGRGARRIRALSWRLLAERFEAYLEAKGGGDLGMVVSDASNRTIEEEIKKALREAEARTGRRKGRRSLVLGHVAFTDSRGEPLIQAADTAAYILQRHCGGDASFAGWFDTLCHGMWKDGDRIRGFGIKHCPAQR